MNTNLIANKKWILIVFGPTLTIKKSLSTQRDKRQTHILERKKNIIQRLASLLRNVEPKAWSILKYWLPCVYHPIELSTDKVWIAGISPRREVFMNIECLVLSGNGSGATTTLVEWLKTARKKSNEEYVSLMLSPGLRRNQGWRFKADSRYMYKDLRRIRIIILDKKIWTIWMLNRRIFAPYWGVVLVPNYISFNYLNFMIV